MSRLAPLSRGSYGIVMRRLCVFCGSATGNHPDFADAALQFGREMARRNIGLVYGGGNIGLMGILADAVLAGGGSVIGVIPRFLESREIAHRGVQELHVVETMHERKALMADLADGFAALPGGFGTWDELCEILTWGQLRLHSKPCGVLNVRDYFAPLLQQVDHAVATGFVPSSHAARILTATSATALIDALTDRDQTQILYKPSMDPR